MIVKRKFRYTLEKGKFMNMIHQDKCKVKYMPQGKLTRQKLEQNVSAYWCQDIVQFQT